MKLRSGKTYSYLQPKESQRSTSIGFFDTAIPIVLLLYSEIDFEKIDARIKTNLKDDERPQPIMHLAGHRVNSRIIYVPKTCHKEIIEKLNDQAGIQSIDGKNTMAWLNFLGEQGNIETRSGPTAKRQRI